MRTDNYIPIMGDWYIGTDGLSFLLLKKRIVRDTSKAKEGNIGKERYDTMGYYATLGGIAAGLHRYLSMEVLMNSGASTLEEYVAELKERIDGVKRLDEALVDRLREQMGAGNE